MRYRFVDCAYELDRPEAGRERYLEAHVPGASFLELAGDLSDLSIPDQGRHPLPCAESFAAAASRAGIGDGVFAVAYDHGAGGGAARLWLSAWSAATDQFPCTGPSASTRARVRPR